MEINKDRLYPKIENLINDLYYGKEGMVNFKIYQMKGRDGSEHDYFVCEFSIKNSSSTVKINRLIDEIERFINSTFPVNLLGHYSLID